MRRTISTFSLLALATALVFGAACGIPEEQHNALKKDLARIRAELAKTKGDLSKSQGDNKRLEEEKAALGGQKDALAKRLGATRKEIEQLRRARALEAKRLATFRKLLSRLRKMIDSGKLEVTTRKGRMIVKLKDKILFDPGKTKLKKDGSAALKELAAVLKEIDKRDFLVAGHTDNVPIRTRRFRSNWELSAARAVQVVKFLQRQGVDPKHLAAAGYSEYDPVGDNSTKDGKRSNRRIEIVLMPNIEELPRFGKGFGK
ncbi:MAG: OmpA family protein [Myxococcales bacterium]|nr:OmpA family protein [Myxococcales bacterium]